jgi:patatin-like phospholipase/acyl hydrolase
MSAVHKKIRILSIDGGGIRGVVPALLLRRLEQDLNIPIHQLFDYVVGTSTGGLIALALAKPGVGGGAAFSAASVADFYEREGPTLFSGRRFSLLPFGKPRYGNAGVEAVVGRVLGNTLLSESLTEVMVTAYDMSNRCPKLFSSWEARALNSENFYMRDVARATTAAPTYFAPALIAAHDSTAPPLHLVDGGVFANNPTARGFFEVTHEELIRGAKLEDTEFIVVSLGTGMFKKPYAHEQTRKWGLLEWSRPLLDVVFDGIGESVDYQLRGMFDSGKWQGRYYRFQGELEPSGAELDNASKASMQRLRDLAGRIYERNKDSYGRMVRDLARPHEVSGISMKQRVA